MYLNKYGGGYGIILLPTFGCDSVQYFIGGAGNFIIGLTTSFPTDIASLRYSNITGIRSGAYGYRQVISQKLNIGNSGNIATKGYIYRADGAECNGIDYDNISLTSIRQSKTNIHKKCCPQMHTKNCPLYLLHLPQQHRLFYIQMKRWLLLQALLAKNSLYYYYLL